MAKLHAPEKFSFRPNEWEEWIEEFSRYRRATKLHKEDGETQRDTLIYVMGKPAGKIFKTLKFEVDAENAANSEKDTDYATLVKKFTEYFIPKRNLRHERSYFHEKTQGEKETVEEFSRELHARVASCDYKDPDEQMCDRFVVGLRDMELRQKLELIDDLTLDQAVSLARRHEQVKSQLAEQELHREVSEAKATASRGAKAKSGRKRRQKAKKGATSETQKCQRCGYEAHQQGQRCPASGQSCNKCKKRGHFASVCQSTDEVTSQEQGTAGANCFLGAVDGEPTGAWYEPLQLNGHTVRFKIDTGADVSVVSSATWRTLGKPTLKPTQVQLSSPGGKLRCLGEFTSNVKCKDRTYTESVVVIENSNQISLLAREAATRMGLVARLEEVQHFGQMDTEPVEIKLRGDATPYCVTTARKVPFPLMDAVKAELDKMLEDGIVREVTEPTDWCSPMVPVVKASGGMRICVDLKRLNQAVRREHYGLPSLEDIAPHLQGSTVFSKLDAASGFWQVPLASSSQLLTTFITPFGRYAFTRLPFGICSASEIFQRKMSDILSNLEGVEVIIDDVLVHGTEETHDKRLHAAQQAMKKAGIRLNDKKCELRKSSLTYFGHLITAEGIQPDPERVRALVELEPPTNVGGLRTILGMFQYLGKFVNNMSTVMKPMTDLLKSDVSWTWGPAQEGAFKEAKRLVASTPTLVFYDAKRPTVVSADASSFGLGAVLLQLHGTELKPVAYCSRTLSEAERRYAQIEKECLAAVWACEKFARYLVGLPDFKVLTDHKPLVPLFNTKDIDKTPVRCQRLLLRMMRFNPTVQYVPGKEQVVSDALSRKPLNTTNADDIELSSEVQAYVDAVESGWPTSPGRLEEIRRATEDDRELRAVADFVINGWPQRQDAVPASLYPYYHVRSDLSVADGLLIYRDRIVIPVALRSEMLKKLHETHQHISKTRERAAGAIWWPHISKDIKVMVESCAVCQQHRVTQREQPLKPVPLPERPWAQLGADLFEYKKKMFLVVVDYYSRWIEVKQLTTTTSASVISRLKAIFTTFGIPDVLITDNGPQFSAGEFAAFAKNWGFGHHTTNPYKPQENGMAERAVRTAKELLRLEDPELGLLNYRATPHSSIGVSPAMALMGRQVQTRLPVLSRHLMPSTPNDSIRQRDEVAKQSYKKYYDARHGARALPSLDPGDQVRCKLDNQKTWSAPAQVVETSGDNRSVTVSTGPEGNVYRRSRKHLQPVPVQQEPTTEHVKPATASGNAEPVKDKPPATIPDTDTQYRSRVSGRVIRTPLRYQE